MTRTTVADWSLDPESNTEINDVFIGERCPGANLNNADRNIMAQTKAKFDLVDSVVAGLTASLAGKQPASANLDKYAAVNPTTAGLALLDDANAAAQLVTLGGGTVGIDVFKAADAQGASGIIGISVPDFAALKTQPVLPGKRVSVHDPVNGGLFKWRAENMSATVPALDPFEGWFVSHATIPTTTGVWERDSTVCRPVHFRCAMDGVTDDIVNWTRFNNFISAIDVKLADVNGVMAVSSLASLGSSSGITATKSIMGRLTVKALNSMDTLFKMQNLQRATWRGGMLDLFGTGNTTVSTRTVTHGLVLENNFRFAGPGVNAQYFRGWGVIPDGVSTTPSNNNFVTLGKVQCYDCGASYVLVGGVEAGLTANWSARANIGGSGSTAQYTTVSVDVMPDSWIDSALTERAHKAVYAGRCYTIVGLNRVANTIDLYPWPPLTHTGGQLLYATGGGINPRGGDAGQIFCESFDAIRCAEGGHMAQLYGGVWNNFSAQRCGIGISLGANGGAASYGNVFNGAYFEGNEFDVARVSRDDPPTFQHTFVGTKRANNSKMWSMASPRLAAGTNPDGDISTLYDSFVGVDGLAPPADGFEARPNNGDATTNTHTILIDRPHRTVQLIRENASPVTMNLAIDADLARMYGYKAVDVAVSGTGARGEFTGSVTFVPPAGGTINGGAVDATLVFSGFYRPARWRVTVKGLAWTVRIFNGRERPDETNTVSTNANFTITPWTTAPITIHTGTLTADRTITLATTNAIEGMEHDVVRTGSGAFNLSVGGLKNLATGQRCRVRFTGAAFVLVEFSTL